jgi:hypothetical protein
VRADMIGSEQAFELADLFCRGAKLRVDALFGELWDNEDDHNYKAAMKVLEGRYDFVEEGVVDPADLIENAAKGRKRRTDGAGAAKEKVAVTSS